MSSNNSGNNSQPIYISGNSAGAGQQSFTWIVPNWQTVPITVDGITVDVSPEEKKKNSDGCVCIKCKEYYEFAVPNQVDNTLICWACRHNY